MATRSNLEDVNVLLQVLQKLVDKGNTVLVIEHNMEVIKVADHIIDLSPEGGEKGGEIVCEGTPEEIVAFDRKLYRPIFGRNPDQIASNKLRPFTCIKVFIAL